MSRIANARRWLGGVLNRSTAGQTDLNSPRIMYVPRTVAGVHVNHDTAFKSSVVWACVRVISETIGQLPWDIYERTSEGERRKIDNSPLRALLSRQPNPETTAFHFRRTLMAHALTWGNGYAEIVRDGMGRAVELWTLAPDRVCPDRDSAGNLVYEVIKERGERVILPPEQVLHIPGLGFDGVTGYSVISYAAQSIGLALAADTFGTAFFANGGALGYIFKHPHSLNSAAAKRLTESLDAKLTGERAFKWLVLEEGMNVEVPGAIPKDAQWSEARQQQVADICRWFRVPPHKVADLLRATFSNIEHQSIEFVTDTLQPWITELEQEVDRKLLGPAERSRLFSKVNLNALLRGDTAARTALYTAMLDRGVFSINDVRRLEDLNGIGPDGDKRMVPQNMTTLAKLGTEPAAPAPSEPDDDEPGDDEPIMSTQKVAAMILRDRAPAHTNGELK